MADIQGEIVIRLRNWRLRLLEIYSGYWMKVSLAITTATSSTAGAG